MMPNRNTTRKQLKKMLANPPQGPFLEYQITGGDKLAKDQNGNLKYGYMENGKFESFKVLPEFD